MREQGRCVEGCKMQELSVGLRCICMFARRGLRSSPHRLSKGVLEVGVEPYVLLLAVAFWCVPWAGILICRLLLLYNGQATGRGRFPRISMCQ
eukprot:scaffold129017_cov18-Tisochrysis_lutea.AAC.3